MQCCDRRKLQSPAANGSGEKGARENCVLKCFMAVKWQAVSGVKVTRSNGCIQSPSGMSQSALMGMWLWTLQYFRNFCMSILWKVVSYTRSRDSLKKKQGVLLNYCMCIILMLLHLKIYFVIIQTLCISIQSNQRWVLNTTILIWSYFVLHFL